jgi:hypothetical protein
MVFDGKMMKRTNALPHALLGYHSCFHMFLRRASLRIIPVRVRVTCRVLEEF